MITNTLAGYRIEWDFQDHLYHGYDGGTDYIVPRGTPVRAPAAGRFLWTSRSSCAIILPDQRTIVLLELHNVAPIRGDVAAGEVIGAAGTKYVHIHGLLSNGKRVPFESFLSAPAGGDITPIPDPIPPPSEEDDMRFIYLHPTENSSPINGVSRIWAGYRTLNGIAYADVWQLDRENGKTRRLTAAEWTALNTLTAQLEPVVIDLSGNALEIITFAPAL